MIIPGLDREKEDSLPLQSLNSLEGTVIKIQEESE